MPPPRSNTIARVEAARCERCGLCLPLCPPGAIAMRSHGLVIDEHACTGCRKCIAPCPVNALAMTGRSVARDAVAGRPAPGA